MRASQLIDILKKTIEVSGDLEIGVVDDTANGAHLATNVMTVIKRKNPNDSRILILNYKNEKQMMAKQHMNVNVGIAPGEGIIKS